MFPQVYISNNKYYYLFFSLYCQSYAQIAHLFVDYITEYQKLQGRYEKLLEKNYKIPSFLEEEEEKKKTQQVTQQKNIVCFLSFFLFTFSKSDLQCSTSSLKHAWKVKCNIVYLERY
jgi:hypothetical protein